MQVTVVVLDAACCCGVNISFRCIGPANRLYLILFVVLYFLSLIGLLITKNIEDVTPYLRVRISLIIIPVLLALSNDLIRKNFRQILLSFVLGILIASAYCYIGALMNSIHITDGSLLFNTHPPKSPWESYFLYDRFSVIMHPSYFAMYINMAIAILLISFNRKEIFLTKKTGLKVLIVAYLSITLFLLSSRAGLLTWVLVFCYLFLIIGFEKFRIKKNLLGFYPLILLVGLFLFIVINGRRFSVIKDEVEEAEKPYNKDEFLGSVTFRIILWEDAIENIIQHPVWGVGTGNVKHVLYKKTEDGRLNQAKEKNLNVHDQFLETWLEQGIFALMILLAIIFYPIFSRKFPNRYLLTFLSIIIVTNFLFESVLNRLWGVAFFSFFYSLLAFVPRDPAEKSRLS